MSTITLPLEILTVIFKYNQDDHKTLYSCICVNKQWHNINVPLLWKSPFISKDSTKIVINCLLEEDKDFLARNSIELIFDLLEKPPLYNYVQFCTRLHLINDYSFRMLTKTSGLNILRNRLIEFTLDHSAIIRDFSTFNIDYYFVNNYHRFNNSFQDLNELICYNSVGSEFIDKLTDICKSIQSLEIYYSKYNNKFEDSLTQLIRAQNKIKQLSIFSDIDQTLSDNFKQAILPHSQSITNYSSSEVYDLDNILLPTLYNLKSLSLASYATGIEIKYLENISLPNLESVTLYIYNQPFLSELSDFINNNGKKLKCLDLWTISNDSKSLGNLFQSIAQCCKNLVNLSIAYKDKVDQELMEIFDNCIRLESIEFKIASAGKIDCNRVLAALNQTLPRRLKLIIINNKIFNINVNSFDNLMKNWRGPKPFTIKFKKSSDINSLNNLIKKYQDLGFLN